MLVNFKFRSFKYSGRKLTLAAGQREPAAANRQDKKIRSISELIKEADEKKELVRKYHAAKKCTVQFAAYQSSSKMQTRRKSW
jgi:hypothetical protein